MGKHTTRILETELTHSRNMLSIAREQIEMVLDTGDTSRLSNVLSVITKTEDNIDDQLDVIMEMNLKTA